jgi:hypothetical protein
MASRSGWMAGLLCALAAASASAADYYVSPGGDDGNPGTRKQPWRTIQKAAEAVSDGGTIRIGPGAYNERVVLRHSGQEGNPLVFMGAPDHMSILSGAGLPRSWGLLEMHGRSHIVIDGLKVTEAPEVGILVHESDNVALRNCHTAGTGSSGILVWQSRDVLVTRNEVEDACRRGWEESLTVKFDSERVEVAHNHIHDTRKEGIDVKEGARHVRVHDNHIHHASSQGLYADAWNRDTGDIRFYNNVVHDCGFGVAACAEAGGLLRDVWFYSNIIYNNAGPGLVVADWGKDHMPHRVQGIRFLHNTLHNNGASWGGGMLIENTEAQDIVVRNNVFSACGPPHILINRMPKSLTIVNNLFHGGGGLMGEDPIQGDPLFVDPAAADFHLRAGSPAIDAAALPFEVDADFEGDPRSTALEAGPGGVPDLGADEYRQTE